MDLTQLTNLSPELFTIAFLNVMGLLLKKIKQIDDKWIPLLLALFGACVKVGTDGWTTHNVMYGVLMGAGAVFGNQVYRQMVTQPVEPTKPDEPTWPSQPTRPTTKEDPKP